MREGSLEAPIRHPIAWNDPDFYDESKLDAELRRVFDICHGCRRCFNLCDSFPRLFDLIDDSPTGELDSVDSAGFKRVVDACTLCDLCFMTKCPYVPPHDFNLDFPHLMLRFRAVEAKRGEGHGVLRREMAKTDRNGALATKAPALANWATRTGGPARRPMQAIAGVHKDAALPRFTSKTLRARAKSDPIEANPAAPAFGRKAVIYATCTGEWNRPEIGEAARRVLARNGVAVAIAYPGCCGMPQLEAGEIGKVAAKAKAVAAGLAGFIEDGFAVIALVPSCALMMKFEWPLILPGDDAIARLSAATFDVSEYVVDIARKEGLAEGLAPLDGSVAVHIACHARAQNMGQKATELLRLIPGAQVTPVERCSGHGGAWGVMTENFEVGLKVGKPVFRQIAKAAPAYIASECPLAADHILQGLARLDGAAPPPARAWSPIEIFARAYGLIDA